MELLGNKISRMNEAVAEYKEQYDEIVAQIETDGLYVMEGYEEEYQRIKSETESAITELDEKSGSPFRGLAPTPVNSISSRIVPAGWRIGYQ